VVDQGPNLANIPGVPFPVDVSLLTPHIEATLYGPWDPVWEGETHRPGASAQPFWGPQHAAKLAAHPDEPILIISLMENDDGSPDSARSLAKSIAVASLAGSVQMDRAARVAKLVADIHDVLDTPTGAPNFDDRVGTQELRLDYADLVRPWFGKPEKALDFSGDGRRYRLVFEIVKVSN
jgi:hypothetical protein